MVVLPARILPGLKPKKQANTLRVNIFTRQARKLGSRSRQHIMNNYNTIYPWTIFYPEVSLRFASEKTYYMLYSLNYYALFCHSGYEPLTKLAQVTSRQWIQTDFALKPEISSLKYSEFTNIKEILDKIHEEYPDITQIYRYLNWN